MSIGRELPDAAANFLDVNANSSRETAELFSEQPLLSSPYQYEAVRIVAPPDRSGGKKDRIRLFKMLAARCATSVKSKYPDMQDCYSASAAIVDALHARGYSEAMSVGCTVVVANHAGPVKVFGEFRIREKASHAVVIASGCLIDATAGQFRNTGLNFPDYFVFHSHNVLQVLQLNRSALGVQGKVGVNYFGAGPGVLIGYIPTDPTFVAR